MLQSGTASPLVGFYNPSKYTRAARYFGDKAGKAIRKHPNATLAGVYILCGLTFISINAFKTAGLASGASSPILVASAVCGILGSISLVAAGINYLQTSRLKTKLQKLSTKALENQAELENIQSKSIKSDIQKQHYTDIFNAEHHNIESKIAALKKSEQIYMQRGKVLSFCISVPFAVGTVLFCSVAPASAALIATLSVVTSTCFMTGATSKSAKDIDSKIYGKEAAAKGKGPFQSIFGGKLFARYKHHLFTVAGTAITTSSLVTIAGGSSVNALNVASGIGIFGGGTVVALAAALHVVQSARFAKNKFNKNVSAVQAITQDNELSNFVQFDNSKGRFTAQDNIAVGKKVSAKLNKMLRSLYLYGDEPQFSNIKGRIRSAASDKEARSSPIVLMQNFIQNDNNTQHRAELKSVDTQSTKQQSFMDKIIQQTSTKEVIAR